MTSRAKLRLLGSPGAAPVLFMSRYRAMGGRARDYMSFVRAEMYPVMKQAQEDGTFAGLSVTTSVQGGEPGIITLNMHHENFAPLDSRRRWPRRWARRAPPRFSRKEPAEHSAARRRLSF